MYTLNGHPLDNPALGWAVSRTSEWVAPASFERTALNVPGVHGSVPMPGRQSAPALAVTVHSPHTGLTGLLTLLKQPALMLEKRGQAGTAVVEVASVTPTRLSLGENPTFEVSIVFNIPGIDYRDVESTVTTVLDAGSKTVSVFPGISGIVTDSVIRLTDCVNPRVQDSAGSWFSYNGSISSGQYLRFHAASGRAWMTSGDSWSGGTEVSASSIGLGPRPHYLAVTPEFSLTPATRRGKLTVSTSSRGSNAAIAVRGRNAFAV